MSLAYTPELAAIVLRGVSVSVSPQCDRAEMLLLLAGGARMMAPEARHVTALVDFMEESECLD